MKRRVLVDLGAFVALLLLAGCDVVQVDRRTSSTSTTTTAPPAAARYVVEQDTPDKADGDFIIETIARCDEGDRLVVGGCAWGEVVNPHDQALHPLVDAPTDDAGGWLCRGFSSGVGVELKTLRASVVCEAEP